jgi:lipoate-protein ligase A
MTATDENPPGVPSFDVAPYRTLEDRAVRFRRPGVRAVVLGSTQPDSDVSRTAAEAAGLVVLRRRSGGGAVLIGADDPVWIDLWVPRDDPLFDEDIVRAAGWLGAAWVAALSELGAGRLGLHRGGSVAGRWPQVCFAGLGPGEVTGHDRKVVGLAQWRGREGSLFHVAAYRQWDVDPLVEVLELEDAQRERAAADLAASAMGLDELLGRMPSRAEVESALLGNLPSGRRWAAAAD